MLLDDNFFSKEVDWFGGSIVGRGMAILLLEYLKSFLHHLHIVAADAHVLLELLFLSSERGGSEFGRWFLVGVLLLFDHDCLVLEGAVLVHEFLRRQLVRRTEVAVQELDEIVLSFHQLLLLGVLQRDVRNEVDFHV